MRSATVPLTRAGFEKLQRELEHLRTEGRREIAEQIQSAWESEPDKDESVVTGFNAAKDDQAFLEGRIQEIESVLGLAEIIDEGAARASDTVRLGSIVTVESERGEVYEYQILGAPESDPSAGRVSQASPVGAALLGHRRGDTVEVHAPAGVRRLRVKKLR